MHLMYLALYLTHFKLEIINTIVYISYLIAFHSFLIAIPDDTLSLKIYP